MYSFIQEEKEKKNYSLFNVNMNKKRNETIVFTFAGWFNGYHNEKMLLAGRDQIPG